MRRATAWEAHNGECRLTLFLPRVLQVFDALEQLTGPKPYLVLVGALDTRDTSKPPPAHYVRRAALCGGYSCKRESLLSLGR